MNKLSDLVINFIIKNGIDISQYSVISLWDAPRSQAVSISRGALCVNVTDSVVLYHLTFSKRQFIEQLNKAVGKRVVRDITFRVGKVEQKREVKVRELSDAEVAEIDAMVSAVNDLELRAGVREVIMGRRHKLRI